MENTVSAERRRPDLLRAACTVLLGVIVNNTSAAPNLDAYGRLPHGPGFRNVRDFGAKGDGVTDDTAAFIRALDEGRGKVRAKSAANVYVPSGVYALSDTLILWRATLLAGDSRDPPTLLLRPRSPGFGDPDEPKPLIVTACGYSIDAATRDWRTRTNQLGGSTNNTFYITVRHIKIRIGDGNPGAWGLYWLVAQQTALRHVSIDAGQAQGCMRSMLWGGGGVISHLDLRGGDYGWHVSQTSQWVLRSARFRGQRKASLQLEHVWNFVLLDLDVRDTAPVRTRGGHVSLLSSRFARITDDCATDAKGTSLVLSNVTTRGTSFVVRDLLRADDPEETTVSLWAHGTAMVDGQESEGETHDLSACADLVPRGLPSPEYPLPGPNTKGVTELGVVGDGETDDTAALQRAIDQHAELFLPEGTYVVSDTLRLRPDSRIFGEMWTFIQLRADSPGFQEPESRKPLLGIPDDPDASVTVCHLWCRMLTPGGIRTDWRAGENSMLMDVCFANTSKTQQLNWRISGKGGGFFENSWNPGVSGDGLEITSNGRKWMYAVQQEHYSGTATRLRGAANLVALVLQYETSPEYVRLENCRDVVLFNALAGNWSNPVRSLLHVVGGSNIALLQSGICKTQTVVTEEPNGWNAGPASTDRGMARQTVWIKK